ncbi:MAG: acyl-CoA dehydrogenase family protein [Coleofasciculus sp. C1-SOL-03]|jgi:alkylation response protein AidB-like acyl-CoA dehydrogenase|uniref:acyl-CoA dehydrogenase family protein n=1 Tax=Coleofasciculus sp. C1-SOL-03 TaxID=3069522 RepID=UPI0032FFFC31
MSPTTANQGVPDVRSEAIPKGIANPSNLLDVTEAYLREIVAPRASEIDQDTEALRIALKGLGDRHLLALKVPQDWGGAEVNPVTFFHFQQRVSRYSGALAFLQTQHQSAGGFLAKSDNETLKQRYLPRMGRGEALVGVGFSQLRRTGNPPVKATPVDGGYQITGNVPWVTGFGLFGDFVIGATLPDGRELYGIVPFTSTEQGVGRAIAFSQPMALAAMNSTNTVSASLTDWFLPNESVLFLRKAGAIHAADQKNVLNHGFFALGCAKAGLDIIAAAYQRKQLEFIQKAFDHLNAEVLDCEAAMIAALSANSADTEDQENGGGDEGGFRNIRVTTNDNSETRPYMGKKRPQSLQLRAWAINLAGRCTNAAVTVSSGAANLQSHAAQRVYREAVVFTVSGQTTAVMEATLAQLVHSPLN